MSQSKYNKMKREAKAEENMEHLALLHTRKDKNIKLNKRCKWPRIATFAMAALLHLIIILFIIINQSRMYYEVK